MSLRLLFRLLAPGGMRSPLSVLIFHRVHEKPDPLFPGESHAASFERQLSWLEHWCTVLPLADAVDALRRGVLPARAAAITFDDGYADNHDVALPILQRHGLAATFFIATGFLDGGLMWNDALIETMRRCTATMLDLTAEGFGVLRLTSMDERRAAIDTLIGRLKYLPAARRDAIARGIAARAGVALPTDLMLSSAKVRALSDAGMSIGAHTVNHPILAGLPEDEALFEMTESKKRLEAITGRAVTCFSYPNGKPGTDYSDVHVALARKAGFAAAVSTAWGAAKPGCDLFQIPRFTPWGAQATVYGLRLAHNLKRGRYAQA